MNSLYTRYSHFCYSLLQRLMAAHTVYHPIPIPHCGYSYSYLFLLFLRLFLFHTAAIPIPIPSIPVAIPCVAAYGRLLFLVAAYGRLWRPTAACGGLRPLLFLIACSGLRPLTAACGRFYSLLRGLYLARYYSVNLPGGERLGTFSGVILAGYIGIPTASWILLEQLTRGAASWSPSVGGSDSRLGALGGGQS